MKKVAERKIGKRVYLVRDLQCEGEQNDKLVLAQSRSEALRHVIEPLHDVAVPSATEVAIMCSKGCKIEVAHNETWVLPDEDGDPGLRAESEDEIGDIPAAKTAREFHIRLPK